MLRADGAIQMLSPLLPSAIFISHPSSLACTGTHTKWCLHYWYVEP